MIKIRKLLLSIMVIAITSFTFSTVSANDDTNTQNGIATVSGTSDPKDTIEISLPSGKVINVTPNSSGHYSTDISGLSVGDTVYVTAVNKDGKKSQPTKHTITTADVIDESSSQTTTVSSHDSHSTVSKTTYQSQNNKKDQSFSWLTVLLWLSGAIGITVGGTAVVNSRFPKVKQSIFSLVGSGLLWRSQQKRHKVKLVGKINDHTEKAFFDVTTNELKILAKTGEVELNRKFTQFEVKVFNRQNDNVQMVIVDE
ncbi:MAG: hypothetical protein ABF709_10475 [Leuconostoc pseudomesenteroides]|uniref:hypothetical protein n=1 Tax=Leuconostoc pseudomesenteroides TaxID=33968 RepID=UPI001E5494B7|nr:hypothetical protein [Leuconostoc pseudomesenteroides]